MYHTIRFTAKRRVDLEVSSKQALERMLVEPGTRLRAQVKAYVLETKNGPVEVADLFLEDGTATRAVPFACFCFVD